MKRPSFTIGQYQKHCHQETGNSQHLPKYYSLCKEQIKPQSPSELVLFVFLECTYDSRGSQETDI